MGGRCVAATSLRCCGGTPGDQDDRGTNELSKIESILGTRMSQNLSRDRRLACAGAAFTVTTSWAWAAGPTPISPNMRPGTGRCSTSSPASSPRCSNWFPQRASPSRPTIRAWCCSSTPAGSRHGTRPSPPACAAWESASPDPRGTNA